VLPHTSEGVALLVDEPPVSALPIHLEGNALGADAVALGAVSRVRRELADP
jgi:hypothetical protein